MIVNYEKYKSYMVEPIKTKEEKRVDKTINGRKYKNASKLRIYKQRKRISPIRRKDNSEFIKSLQAYYKALGIVTEDRQKAMSCLLYRFRRCNPYYNMLVTIYLEDYTRQDFFNMCYMIAHENDASDFKTMYKALQTELETETLVTRRKKQAQVFTKLSIEELKQEGIEPTTTRDIEHIEKLIDLDILYITLKNTCTRSQFGAIREYLEEGKPFDTRQKTRIKNKLYDNDLLKLLK